MKNRYVLLADLVVFVIAVFGAFGLRFDWYFFDNRPEFVPYVLAAPPIKVLVFYLFGMYGRFWRYATVEDVVALMIANSAASVAMAVFVSLSIFAFGFMVEFSRSVLVVDWILAACARCGRSPVDPRHRRISYRPASAGRRQARADRRRRRRRSDGCPRDAGNPELGMDPVGFLDDDRVKIGKRIYGVPVLGALSQLAETVKARRIDEVIIAMPRVAGGVVRVIAAACRETGVASHTMPGVFELLDGDVSVSRLRQVDITDLLRRDPVVSSPEAGSFVEGRRVLVTGAGGSIGYELCRQIAHGRPQCLVLLGHGENSIFEAHVGLRESFPTVKFETVIADIRDKDRIFRVFDRVQPEIVFHAAAHKHVPLMEENAEEAITNNVIGTQNMIEACRAAAVARFV